MMNLNRRGFFGAIAAALGGARGHTQGIHSANRPVRLQFAESNPSGADDYYWRQLWRPSVAVSQYSPGFCGPMLTITRHGIAIDASEATTPHAEFTWEQIDRWRASVGNRELWLPRVELRREREEWGAGQETEGCVPPPAV